MTERCKGVVALKDVNRTLYLFIFLLLLLFYRNDSNHFGSNHTAFRPRDITTTTTTITVTTTTTTTPTTPTTTSDTVYYLYSWQLYVICFQPKMFTIRTNRYPISQRNYRTQFLFSIPTTTPTPSSSSSSSSSSILRRRLITTTTTKGHNNMLPDDTNNYDIKDDSIIRESSHLISSSSVTTTTTTTTTNRGLNLLGTASSIVPQGIIVTIVSKIWNFIWRILMTELAPQSKDGAYIRPTYIISSSTSSSSTSSTSISNHTTTLDSSVTPLLVRSSHNTLVSTTVPRYHIYVGNPCPWCHRVVLTLNLLQLTNDFKVISLIDNPRQASRGGWILNPMDVHTEKWKDLRDVYNYYYYNRNDENNMDDDSSNREYVGRCTAPLLVDNDRKTIISNESSDIIQLLIQYYDTYIRQPTSSSPQEGEPSQQYFCTTNLYPVELRDNIDHTTNWIYEKLNNGVYRCGFATSQIAYNQACTDVRDGLQYCNTLLSKSTFICSNTTLTVADIYLLPTLLRFDGVYSPLFKAGGTHTCLRSNEYVHIHRYLYHCWNTIPGIRESINITQACTSYYEQLFPLNPSNIIPYPITAHDLGLE